MIDEMPRGQEVKKEESRDPKCGGMRALAPIVVTCSVTGGAAPQSAWGQYYDYSIANEAFIDLNKSKACMRWYDESTLGIFCCISR